MRTHAVNGQIDFEKVKEGVRLRSPPTLPLSLLLPLLYLRVLTSLRSPSYLHRRQKLDIRPLRVSDFFANDYATTTEQEGLD